MKLKSYIILTFATALMAGCDQNEDYDNKVAKNSLDVSVTEVKGSNWNTKARAAMSNDVPADTLWLNDSIYVEAVVEDIVATTEKAPIARATPVTNSNQITTLSIVMFNTMGSNWSTSSVQESGKSPIKASIVSGSFFINPPYQWVEGDMNRRTLIAMSPHHDSDGFALSSSGQSLDVTVQSDVAKQYDLCVSDITKNKNIQYIIGSNSNMQSFEMEHMMTAVGFEAAGYDLMLTGVKFTGVNSKSTLTLNNRTWGTPTIPATFEAKVNPNQWLNSDHIQTSNPWRNITPNDGYMMMIPQTHSDDMTLEFTFDGRNGQPGGTYIMQLNKILASGATSSEWKPGMKITYRLRLKTRPAVQIDNIELNDNIAGSTSPSLSIVTSNDDDLTFSWTASWLGMYRGTNTTINNPESNGYFSPFTTGVNNWTNVKFFARSNNISTVADRTAKITVTGKKSGVRTFTVTQPKLLVGNNYTGKPANCYITQPGKLLFFNAMLKPRVKGGSISSQTTCTDVRSSQEGLNKDILPSSIKRIEVSWQTAANHGTTGGAANMIIQKIEYNATTGVCTVTPHATGTGNAVISAYDAASGGKILWNWHIWVTDGTVGNAGTANGFTFMDRNLGALAATAAKPAKADAYKYFGVYYQHGRSTPFSGQGVGETRDTYTAIYDGAATKLSSGTIGGYTQSNTAVSSVTTAIQNPNTYYYSGTSWYNFADISLWSDYGTNKSIYDPCPYGYRVPKNGSWAGFPRTSWTANIIEGGTVWSNTWWPAAGRRYYRNGALENVGSYGWYWSSSRRSSLSYNLYFYYSGSVYPSNSDTRSLGFPVRCVQE